MESVVCGDVKELGIAGIGFVYMRCMEWARGPSSPTFGTQAESMAEFSCSRAETTKAIRRSSSGVQV